MLLAIDTSTRQAGIALYDDDKGLLAEYNWHSANRHTEELLPATAQMLERAGVTARDLTAVGVAIGPGSFTGLRVGLAAAKGLALAQDLKLVGVSTLDFTASRRRPGPSSRWCRRAAAASAGHAMSTGRMAGPRGRPTHSPPSLRSPRPSPSRRSSSGN